MVSHEHKNEYFECYNGKLKKFLFEFYQIDHIARARDYYNPTTICWLYVKNKDLSVALVEWDRRSKLIKLGYEEYRI